MFILLKKNDFLLLEKLQELKMIYEGVGGGCALGRKRLDC
jgi:hypothetical protein